MPTGSCTTVRKRDAEPARRHSRLDGVTGPLLTTVFAASTLQTVRLRIEGAAGLIRQRKAISSPHDR